MESRDRDIVFAYHCQIARIVFVLEVDLTNRKGTLKLPKMDSSSPSPLVFWKVAILVSYFLHILLRSLPIALEASFKAFSSFLVSLEIKPISKAEP